MDQEPFPTKDVEITMTDVQQATPDGLREEIRYLKAQASSRYRTERDKLTASLEAGFVMTDRQVRAVKAADTKFGWWANISESDSLDRLNAMVGTLAESLVSESFEHGSASLLANGLSAVARDATREWVDEVRALIRDATS